MPKATARAAARPGSAENAREAMKAPSTLGTSSTGARSTSMPSARSARPVARPSAAAAGSPARPISGGGAIGRQARQALDFAALLIDRHQRRRRAGALGDAPQRLDLLAERHGIGALGREQDHAAELAVADPLAQAVGRGRLHPHDQQLPGEPPRTRRDRLGAGGGPCGHRARRARLAGRRARVVARAPARDQRPADECERRDHDHRDPTPARDRGPVVGARAQRTRATEGRPRLPTIRATTVTR